MDIFLIVEKALCTKVQKKVDNIHRLYSMTVSSVIKAI